MGGGRGGDGAINARVHFDTTTSTTMPDDRQPSTTRTFRNMTKKRRNRKSSCTPGRMSRGSYIAYAAEPDTSHVESVSSPHCRPTCPHNRPDHADSRWKTHSMRKNARAVGGPGPSLHLLHALLPPTPHRGGCRIRTIHLPGLTPLYRGMGLRQDQEFPSAITAIQAPNLAPRCGRCVNPFPAHQHNLEIGLKPPSPCILHA